MINDPKNTQFSQPLTRGKISFRKRTEGKRVSSRHTKGWPPERRAAQRARIRAQKPWLQSTGPRSAEGKARAALNATKDGSHGWQSRTRLLNAWFNWQRGFLRRIIASASPVNRHDRPRFHSAHKLARPTRFILTDEDAYMAYKGLEEAIDAFCAV